MGAREAMLLVGLVMLGAGLWWVYPPAAAVVPGGILTLIAVFGIR